MIKNNELMKTLKERGFISQVTDEEALTSLLTKKSITLYCGFDPTADSLHLGHLIPLLCLKRFQEMGHKPIILIGGATGLIGDPSFKFEERKLGSKKIIQSWINNILKQIVLFLDFNCEKTAAVVINNYEWISNMNVLSFLRDIGKYFSINKMINKEAVKQRFNRNNQGISFAEFSYTLLQSYDFAYLNKVYDVTLQIGGSDQWGNITSGIDLTRRLYNKKVFGLTVPLIIKSDGTKFGKTANNTIWLDPNKTSPYDFYQFWINTADSDVYRFLKLFTFIDTAEINILESNKNKKKSSRVAQYILAEHVSRLVHGEDNLEAAKRVTRNIFNNTIRDMDEVNLKQLVKDGIPFAEMNKGINLVQALVNSKLQISRREAREAIIANSITVNGERKSNPEYIFSEKDQLFGRYTLLRRGKKNYFLILWK